MMKKLFPLLMLSLSSFATDPYTKELQFAKEIKERVESAIDKGKLSYVYDEKKSIKMIWYNKNISAEDMANYMKAYNEAHDLERKIMLKRKLDKENFKFTEFAEQRGPSYPEVPRKPAAFEYKK
jgi:hypothetical protein